MYRYVGFEVPSYVYVHIWAYKWAFIWAYKYVNTIRYMGADA
jgi:hypothetical protein